MFNNKSDIASENDNTFYKLLISFHTQNFGDGGWQNAPQRIYLSFDAGIFLSLGNFLVDFPPFCRIPDHFLLATFASIVTSMTYDKFGIV